MTEPLRHLGCPRQTTGLRGLRAEVAALADDFTPVITELWPRLEDHKGAPAFGHGFGHQTLRNPLEWAGCGGTRRKPQRL